MSEQIQIRRQHHRQQTEQHTCIDAVAESAQRRGEIAEKLQAAIETIADIDLILWESEQPAE